jgi:tetratricopeptide (TPR) repeat protein
MQEQKYDESINIYKRFQMLDTTNYTFMDKIGFACLKKGDFDSATEMFRRSLDLNPNNLNAIKNLAYLHARTFNVKTAIKLLSKGMEIDSTDMDLYARRATINFSIFNYEKALSDYMKLLSSGDSSAFNLKRAGLAFANTTHTKEAVKYLTLAYIKDTSDFEVLSNLALNLSHINDYKNSAYYYRRLLKMLNPGIEQLGLYNLLLAEVLKSDSLYSEAIQAYLKSQQFRTDISVYMIIANLYDEKLKDTPNAIKYYELYLRKVKTSKTEYDTDYSESIRKRIESLKKPQQPVKQP